ncbi:MAG TPA: ABC transporter substrate-binding protein [Thermomicrobiales bacterium]|nr:ABC transporter substrate-binding protein [Thermomicrobiales bacterium]
MEPLNQPYRSALLSRRRFLAGASGAVVAAILSACGGASATPTTTASQTTPTAVPTAAPVGVPPTAPASPAAAPAGSSPQPTVAVAASPSAAAGKPGGTKTFRVAVLGDLTDIDPAHITNQNDYQIAETIFNYMARHTYNPPLGTAINPELAEWEVQDGAKTYIFHLKKGVQFHYGYGELTAADVKSGWEHIKDQKTGSPYRNDFLDGTIDVIDPYTIKISFSQPYPAFIPASLAFRPGFVVSSKAFAELGTKWNTRPIGSGPFMFDTYQAATSLTVKRNPDYWGTKPKIDQVVWKMRVDDRAAVLAIAKGELDAYYIADPDVALGVAKNPDPNTHFFKSQFGQSPWSASFNMKRKPLDDVRVRQALRYAIDNNAIAKDLFGGLADPIQSFLPPFMFGYNADVTPRFDYNPDKARQLLKEANVPADWAPTAMTVSALVISRRILEAVASYWKDVGVNVKVDEIEQGLYNQRSLSGDYDMNANYISRIDPDQIATPSFRSTTNRNGYTGADDLIDQARAEPDTDKRAQLYHQLQNKISQDSPAAFVVAVSEHLLLNKRVTGIAGAGWQERYDWFNVDVPAE